MERKKFPNNWASGELFNEYIISKKAIIILQEKIKKEKELNNDVTKLEKELDLNVGNFCTTLDRMESVGFKLKDLILLALNIEIYEQ